MKKTRLLLRRRTACFLTVFLLLLSAFPVTAFAGMPAEDDDTIDMPVVNFTELGLGVVPDRTYSDGTPIKCVISDLFYIEYPGSWSFGANDYCPLVLFHDSMSAPVRDFQSFDDPKLIGSASKIDQYVKSGGINTILKKALQTTITGDYSFVLSENYDPIVMYVLKKGNESIASIVIWGNLGQVSIRDERSTTTVSAADDYGKFMLFPEYSSEDFSSLDALRAYWDSGRAKRYTNPFIEAAKWEVSTYSTGNQDYLYCVGTSKDQKMAVYIPVTAAEQPHWVAVFTVSQGTQKAQNAFALRETMIKSFRIE